MTLTSPASSGSGSPSWSDRLAVQVQQLSEVAERLTYRLLELEERLALQEQQFEALQQSVLPLPDGMPIERCWSQTEERLARMEAALQAAPVPVADHGAGKASPNGPKPRVAEPSMAAAAVGLAPPERLRSEPDAAAALMPQGLEAAFEALAEEWPRPEGDAGAPSLP
ncbi:MAG: hypothetical protein ACKOXO_12935 [Cyanobium sp.]